MTRNQIAFWTLEETKRSNRVNEAETHRSNVARETETNRHNVVTEIEVNRHNVVTEIETERHNRATELLTQASIAETARHNQAQEGYNMLVLGEQQRSNRANEQLKSEATQASYSVGMANVGLGYAQLKETSFTHRNAERFNLLSLDETKRQNDMQNELQQQRNDEQARTNLANEILKEQQIANQQVGNIISMAGLGETKRHNLQTEAEAQLHNRTDEFIREQQTVTKMVDSVVGILGNLGGKVG